jgi:hypothetical protein
MIYSSGGVYALWQCLVYRQDQSVCFMAMSCLPTGPVCMSMVNKRNKTTENGNTRRNTCPSITDPINTTQTGQGMNQGLRAQKAATNSFSYDAPPPPSSVQVMNRCSHTQTPP